MVMVDTTSLELQAIAERARRFTGRKALAWAVTPSGLRLGDASGLGDLSLYLDRRITGGPRVGEAHMRMRHFGIGLADQAVILKALGA